MKTNLFSKVTLVILLIAGMWGVFKVHRWENPSSINYDTFNYYAYLPALFIKHDLSLSFIDKEPEGYFAKNLPTYTSPTGVKFTKMTMGCAILYSPFYFVAHISAKYLNYPQDGFSLPYRMLVTISGLIYGFLGLIILRKVLLRKFNDTITTITLLCLALGTNLMYYSVIEPMMSHAFNFFFFALLIYLTIKWYEKPIMRNAIFLGVCFAFIVLIRASNMVVILFPLLYGVTNKHTLIERMNFIKKHALKILVAGIFALALFIPQFLYWKMISGHYLYYAYLREYFFFLHPKFRTGLFGYRKGWFVYTPIMVFAVAGFVFLKRKLSEMFLPILLYFIINIWVVLSWWCWWYGGSFGLRAFIESYALLAFPLACILQLLFSKKWVAIPISLVLGFLCFLNIFQSWQACNSLINCDSMTKTAYWKVFLRKDWPADYEQMLQHPDFGLAMQGLPDPEKTN